MPDSSLPLPPVLTIAGSDNSAGAGIQADLKTISALGGYALTAVTCVVAEVPGKVSAIQAMSPSIVAEQIRLSFEAFPVAAVKTGMLYSREIIEMVCGVLETARVGRGERLPLIVDPVMVATSGDPLIRNEAVEAYCERLIPMATLITPNLDEVATLLGRRVGTVEEMRQAGLELHKRFGCSVLVKGGHLRESAAVDVLVEADRIEEFTAPFVPGVSTHGTGCTYSAAIATELALGRNLVDAVRTAKGFVTMAINRIQRWSRGNGPTDALDHFGDRR